MRRSAALILAVAALAGFGCSGNMGTTGQDTPPDDAGAPQDGAGGAVSQQEVPVFDASGFDVGTVHWSDLYAAYFGPDGVASCTAQSICHGNAAQTGATASGFVCGQSSASCYQGMGNLVTFNSSNTSLTGTFLYSVLRKDDGSGNMPNKSLYTFQPQDLARINAWIESGSPEN